MFVGLLFRKSNSLMTTFSGC